MKNSLESISSGLVAQLTEIDRELQSASQRVVELKATRRKVVAAVKALDVEEGTSTTKPAPKKAQVRQAICDLLADNGGAIVAEDLEDLVAQKLADDHGCSAMGLALRMREALTTDQFTTKGDHIVLAATKNQPPPPGS